ncbi:ACP S-malonyltransferase [Photorhabdus sp. RM71S]|uniref:ACP S-malonyltransferase n=1 Tax=Photorhabdus sp. RM71S TaxID=3342824 RepID=UPI0036D7D341
MITFMFPGQGSQKKGMGGSLFDEFGKLTKKADDILGYSIKELCLNDPLRELNQTQFTQPALYVINAFSYLKKIKETGTKPDYVIGHSLGEFNALLAANCFDFEDGLRIVQKRGELMSKASNGSMAAIVDGTKQQIEDILHSNNLMNIDIANYNTHSQFVISGLKQEIDASEMLFRKTDMHFYPLNASGAFHSRFMESAKNEFHSFLQQFQFNELTIPVISNMTAQPYVQEQITDTLSGQISNAVKWFESVEFLVSIGNPMEFVEIGFSEVLTKLVDKIITTPQAKKVEATPQLAQPGNSVSRDTSKPLSALEKVKAWNYKNPVGTKVKSTTMNYNNLETRTEAVVLFGHRAAIYMKGYNGYFDLDEIVPI